MTLVEIGSTRTQMFFDLETNGITMGYTRNDDPSSRHALQVSLLDMAYIQGEADSDRSNRAH